jgi:uncharacterized protein YbjT (DUF2867 family)
MQSSSIKAIITGATGMVGEGVLYVCLQHPDVASVLVINRKPCGVSHPKLTEIIHSDFYDLSAAEGRLTGYNACFFCLGVSSVGMPAEQYFQTTYTLTMEVAKTLGRLNPDMSFCYISGAGTDSSEKGRIRWARVKGKTENDLMRLPFRQVFGVRPGFIKPLPGQVRIQKIYRYIGWIFPLGRVLRPSGFCRMQELALAMVRVVRDGYAQRIIEGGDIIRLAAEETRTLTS